MVFSKTNLKFIMIYFMCVIRLLLGHVQKFSI